MLFKLYGSVMLSSKWCKLVGFIFAVVQMTNRLKIGKEPGKIKLSKSYIDKMPLIGIIS